MTEGTEQEGEEMETTAAVAEIDPNAARISQVDPDRAQGDRGPGIQGLNVSQLTPEGRDGLMKTLTELQKMDASEAIDPSFQCREGQELVQQSQEVAARSLQGGNASLDGAMASPSGSDIEDPVDPQHPEKMEDGEIPPSPEHEGEHMDISTEEEKGSENEGDNPQELEGWQEMAGPDGKGFDPSQSQLGLSGEEDSETPVETRWLSQHEKEMLKREHAQKFPPTALYISHKPDADDEPSS